MSVFIGGVANSIVELLRNDLASSELVWSGVTDKVVCLSTDSSNSNTLWRSPAAQFAHAQ